MNIKKLMAGSLAAITAGATLGAVAFGAGIGDYVSNTDGTLTSPMVVIGSSAGSATEYPKDVVAAADLAAHVAGYATTPVAVAGSAKSFSISGEGKEVGTTNTQIFLDNSLGKSGLRSTMTSAELPTFLASDQVIDKNSTTIKYDQFLFLTPSSTSSASYTLQFERPSSSSSDDGMYTFGRFPTSPTKTDYFANYRLNFKKDSGFSALVGKTLNIAGETYTVLANSVSVGTPKLEATKAAASKDVLVSDGDVDITVGSSTYTVKVIGTSDSTTAVVAVNGVSKSATKGATTNINGVDVYVDDVFHFANNQESSGAKLLVGAEKVIFQNASKIKVGTNEDSIDGTYVVFTQSGGDKISTMDIYFGASASSVTDNLKAGNWYKLPGLSKLALFFPGVSEDLTASTRNTLKVVGSGDNLLQSTWTDFNGKSGTITWGYKASSTGTTFSLADSNGNTIQVKELANVSQDQYVVLDAGDFPHLMQLTSVSSDSLSFTLKDVFSGDSVKYELASSDLGKKTIYIDGQAYKALFDGIANTTVSFSWGDNAGFNTVGDSTTIWPTLKGKNGERLALVTVNETIVNATTGSNTKIQLPTGAVNISLISNTTGGYLINLTAITDEDGESSACTTTPCVTHLNLTAGGVGQSYAFTLGKTSTGGLKYNVSAMPGVGNSSFNITIVGSADQTNGGITQPGFVIFEEKDDTGDRYAVLVTATTETSGSNNVAIPAAPIFTATEDSQSRGTDSTITDYVDLYGIYAVRTTSGQDTLTLYYPDDQVYAIVGAGSADATASIGGASGTTVNAAVVITSPVAKLDNEVSTTTLASDLILVGGPCANTLVATLAADAANGIPTCEAWSLTTGLIKEVSNAFGSGRKALVVAGTNADDTRDLAALVMGGTLSYEV
ncbi:MAG: S-layer protein [Candidatus Aenigmarchaeota archaeon]|nr:S-layer protein [Candidatus Aenigmarchaeota archaeon]